MRSVYKITFYYRDSLGVMKSTVVPEVYETYEKGYDAIKPIVPSGYTPGHWTKITALGKICEAQIIITL